MIVSKEFLLQKYRLNENLLAASAAAMGIAGGAMAMPPKEDIPHIDRVLQGLGSAEHRGRLTGSVLDYNPKLYIRTGKPDPILNRGKDPSEIKHSTAYGPFQWTKSTINDLQTRHPKLFAGTEDYTKQFTAQGQRMLKDPADPVYGYGKSGVLGSEEHHEGYMNMSRAGLAAMAKDLKIDLKTMSPEQEKALIKRYRGLNPEKSYMSAYNAGKDIQRTTNVTTQEKSVTTQEKPKPVTNQGAPATPSHTVESGDNLSNIAKKYGKNLADVIKSNPQLKDPNVIKPGQRINIPK